MIFVAELGDNAVLVSRDDADKSKPISGKWHLEESSRGRLKHISCFHVPNSQSIHQDCKPSHASQKDLARGRNNRNPRHNKSKQFLGHIAQMQDLLWLHKCKEKIELAREVIPCNDTKVSNTPAILEIVMARISQPWDSKKFNSRHHAQKDDLSCQSSPLHFLLYSYQTKSRLHGTFNFISQDPSQSTTFNSSLIIANRDVSTCTPQLSLVWGLLARGENSLQWYQSSIPAILEETAMTRTTQPQATEKRL